MTPGRGNDGELLIDWLNVNLVCYYMSRIDSKTVITELMCTLIFFCTFNNCHLCVGGCPSNIECFHLYRHPITPPSFHHRRDSITPRYSITPPSFHHRRHSITPRHPCGSRDPGVVRVPHAQQQLPLLK